MKKILINIFVFVSLFLTFSCSNQNSDEAMEHKMESLINTLWRETSCVQLDTVRLNAMAEMQIFGDSCSHMEFAAYHENTNAEEGAKMKEGSILYYYDKALKHILKEIPKQKVDEGTVVMWQLYNMGYIVKTPTHCFGIDIFHKDATELVPYLDFLLITHEHSDHYAPSLISAMTKAGKAVYSNFVENEFKITGTQNMKVMDDIEIETNIVDHNTKLRNFVVSYQIDCGKASGNCVIMHIGDCFNADQLQPTKDVDIFIPHLAVGLDMPKAIENVKPEVVLMSHIMELGHPVNKWRWSYEYGVARCKELAHEKVYLPVWGEKITYKKP